MTPILFLDIDGVLNSERFRSRWQTRHEPPYHLSEPIDPGCVAVLNEVTSRAGAALVLSSAWRLFDLDMPGILRDAGVEAELVGQTPDLLTTSVAPTTRGREVAAWLDEHGWRPFACVEDLEDMAPVQHRTVVTGSGRTDHLRREHVEPLVELLGRPAPMRPAKVVTLDNGEAIAIYHGRPGAPPDRPRWVAPASTALWTFRDGHWHACDHRSAHRLGVELSCCFSWDDAVAQGLIDASNPVPRRTP